MTYRSRIREDLKVISTLCITTELNHYRGCFIPKKMNLVISIQELKTIRLIPTLRNNIKRDLSSNQIHKTIIAKFLLQHLHHLLTHMVNLVIFTKSITLFLRTITSNWADIDHSRTELNKCTSLYRNIQVTQVSQHKVDKPVQLFIRIFIRYKLSMKSTLISNRFVEFHSIVIRR